MHKQTLKQLIKVLKLDYCNENITETNFLDDGQRGGVEILHFDSLITETEEVITQIEEKGYRPATIYELLIWAKDNWNGKDIIVALGSVWRGLRGGRSVPYLWSGSRERILALHWFEGDWGRDYRFAAVRKSLDFGTLNRQQIIEMADKKMKTGEKKYGVWNPKTDKRNLQQEMTDELIDFINYAIMQVMKLNK